MNSLYATGVLVTFSVFNVVLLKNERTEIPTRDVVASGVLVLSSYAALLLEELYFHHKKTKTTISQPTTKTYRRDAGALMISEVIFNLIVPWILLLLSSNNNAQIFQNGIKLDHDLLLESEDVMGYLLVPHLFYFQSQIVAEAMFFMAERGPLVFPYTCIANGYRLLPLATWIMRSIVAFREVSLFDPFHWFVVIILPLIATLLWAFSSLVFIPVDWYPLTKATKAISTAAPPESSSVSPPKEEEEKTTKQHVE